MRNIQKFIKEHIFFLSSSLLLIILSLAMASTWYRYQINPDATSYFTIAIKYSHLDFRHAINGYWGPMLSWLLVPAAWLHISLNLAAKWIAVMTAGATMFFVYFYLINKSSGRIISSVIALITGLMLLPYALSGPITPDLLEALWTTIFVALMVSYIRRSSVRLAITIAITGAFMYFSKAFGFYLFIIGIIIGLIISYIYRRTYRLNLRHFLIICGVFALLTLPFISVISIKYHKLTINTAGQFDLNLWGPRSKGTFYPMSAFGPLKPPNTSAVSVWEDPTSLIPLFPDSGWSPLHSLKDANYYIFSVFEKNIQTALTAVKTETVLVSVGFLAMIIGAIRRGKNQLEFLIFFIIGLALILGYSLVYLEMRYILASFVLAIISAGLALKILRDNVINNFQIIILGGVLICIGLWSSTTSLVDGRSAQKYIYVNAQNLKTVLPPGSHVISDTFDSLYICYYLQLQCYSNFNPANNSLAQYNTMLDSQNIKYFLYYPAQDEAPVIKKYLSQYGQKITQTNAGDQVVEVYKLNI